MSTNDGLAEAMRPIAQRLTSAVDNDRADQVQRILTALDTQELYALAVVLAAHVDVPIVEPKRRPRHDFDEVVVRRIISGDAKAARGSTHTEKIETVRRVMDAGDSLNHLERMTGWNVWALRREIAGEVAA